MKKKYIIIILIFINILINTNYLYSKNSNELYEKIDLFSEVLETIKKATGKEIKPPKQFLNISDKDEKYDILENKVSEIKNYILEKAI